MSDTAQPALFLVYVGGRAGSANIELHDVRFVAGQRIEDTYAALRQQWFGDPHTLHMDTYMRITNIDNFAVTLSRAAPQSAERLYFVNLGGYDPRNLAELHEFGLLVAKSPDEAKKRAKASLLASAESQHKDDLYDVDECLCLDKVGRWFVHLEPAGKAQIQKPDWFGYKVLAKPSRT